MTKSELINKSLLPYLKGEKPFGFDGIDCVYYNPTTKACCAIGQWLKIPEEFAEKIGIGANELFGTYTQTEILQDEVQNILSIDEWECVQAIHDYAAKNDGFHSALMELEKSIGEPLPELHKFLPF